MVNLDDKSLALLEALRSGPGYGLDLVSRVQTRHGIALSLPDVHPILRDLETEGLLVSWNGETAPAKGARPRRYYALTPEGERHAREALQTEPEARWRRIFKGVAVGLALVLLVVTLGALVIRGCGG